LFNVAVFLNCFSEDSGESKKLKKPWVKALYKNQGVPDNYVDTTFLTEMKKNLFVRDYDYYSLLMHTGCITQQIHSVIIFVMCFIYLNQALLDPYALNLISIGILCLCYIVRRVCDSNAFDMKAVIIFCTASFVLSPVLMSLTDTISTDTIYAMATVMLLVHLISHNYIFQLNFSNEGVVSFNAGIFATVCLASRLSHLFQGYSLIVLSVLLFDVLPSLRRYLKLHLRPYSNLFLSMSLFMLSVYMVATQTVTLAMMIVVLFLFITFICPYFLIHLQPIKNNLYGPWDEAVVAER